MTSVYEALADPQRRRILDLLRERPRTVGELVEALALTQPGVSKHLRVLREVGLVSVRREAQRRWYELRTEPLLEVDHWLSAYRDRMEERYSRLEKVLKDMDRGEKGGKK